MELVAVLFVGCILWLLVKAAASSGQRSAGTIEVTLETRGSSSARARDRHRSHEEAYEDGQGLWVPPGSRSRSTDADPDPDAEAVRRVQRGRGHWIVEASMWWIIGVVLIGGLLIWWLANLRGHPSNRLLEVSVATVDGDHYEISYDELRPDVKPVEYVRLALMFAAKMLYNMGDTDAHARQRREFLDTLGKVGSSESGRTVEDDLLSGLASHIAVDEVAGDPSGREIRATLALVDTATRSVYTRLPATWHEYQFLDSWLAILRTVQSRIDDRLTRHLHSSLRRLHELYRSGDEDPMSLSGLASAPNRAFLEAEAV